MRRRLNILLSEHRAKARARRREEELQLKVTKFEDGLKRGDPPCLFCEERIAEFKVKPHRYKTEILVVGFYCECRRYSSPLQFHFQDPVLAKAFYDSVDIADLLSKQRVYRHWWNTAPAPSLSFWGWYTERDVQIPPYYERVYEGDIQIGDLFHSYRGNGHWTPGLFVALTFQKHFDPPNPPLNEPVEDQMVVARPDIYFKQLTMRF